MPIFSSGYGSKSNPVNNDKILISDSEAAGAIKAVSKENMVKSFAGGLLGDTKYFASNGTWTKPAGLRFVVVELVGGGGGGGGCAATGSGEASAGGGGGAGGYARKKILAGDLAATVTVTRGSGGAGGATGANNGGSGGASSFGSHVSAGGGGGGGGGMPTPTQASAASGAGGSGSGGDINIDGGDGYASRCAGGTPVEFGSGADSRLGSGGRGYINTGNVAKLYGGGGSGNSNTPSRASGAGFAGSAGIVIVQEYF